MGRYVSKKIRKQVAKRANLCCEYCLSFEGHAFIKFQIEHIISIKHGGTNELDNLAYSCFYCNNNKGTDLGTITDNHPLLPFYHPRKDEWLEHFEISDHIILPKTVIAKGTIKILGLNEEARLIERLALLEAGFFPHPNATTLIGN